MKKIQFIVITSGDSDVITDFTYYLTQAMNPDSFLSFIGYNADETTEILSKLNTDDVKYIFLGTTDLSVLDVVKSFNYEVNHLIVGA
ncbi:MAG: hypothetical protein RR346_09940 [Bacteroidales bacterium]